MSRATRRTAAALGAALLGCATLGACSSSIGGSGDQGFVGGKGVVTTVPADQRKPPGPVDGETIDGKPLSLHDYAGKVVVVNVWGSWCAPCRAEAPMLAQASRQLAKKGVVFLGLDSRDPSKAAAGAFARRFHVPYPSIYDQDGRSLLAFRGTLSPNSVPSTVIIDSKGRVAASVLGQVDRTTLDGLVQDVRGSTKGGNGA
jgi:thiol-disulfide isomerase/thioredoxin